MRYRNQNNHERQVLNFPELFLLSYKTMLYILVCMAYYFFLLFVPPFKHHHERHQCANSLTSRFLANLRKEKITCSNSVQTSAILSTLPTVVNIRNGKALKKKALICFSLLPSLASQGRSPTTLSLLSLSFVIITEITKEGGHRRQEARGRR